MPFYQYIAYDIDDFDGDTDDDFDKSDSDFDSKNDSKNECDKTICHVTITGDEITAYAVKPEKFGSAYEVIVHVNEAAEAKEEIAEDEFIEDDDDDEPEFECGFVDSEVKTAILSESESSFDDSEIKTNLLSDLEIENEGNDFKEKKYEFKGEESKDEEIENEESDKKDDSDFGFAEIQKYVDLSNPSQFASDTISAALKMSKTTARFVSDVLIRSNVKNMSLDLVYGLSDPADTAVSYGAIHSFNASVYAYLLEAEKKSLSSYRRKRAKQLAAHLSDDVLITPDLTQKTLEADTELSFSFWLPHLYFPTLRFLLAKNTRWFIRRYVYKYYIRQSLKTIIAEQKAKRKAKKNAKKEAKKDKKELKKAKKETGNSKKKIQV